MNLKKYVLLFSSIFLSACFTLEGDPASPRDVATGLVYHTVKYEVVLDGYTERRYIFHRPDGSASYTKFVRTQYGLTEETRVGHWTPAPGQVCYTWKSGQECKQVNNNNGNIVAEHGEIRYRDIGGTQRKNGLRVVEPPEIANAPSLSSVIANSPIGAALSAYAGAVQSVCGPSGCADTASSTTSSEDNSSATGATNRSESGVSSGYRIFQTIPYSLGQSVVARGKCNNGRSFNVRYHPGNGGGARDHAIYTLFGSSVEDVAGKFCS